jgi:hypothetical protein
MPSRPCLDLEIGPAVATRYSLMVRGISDPDEWSVGVGIF